MKWYVSSLDLSAFLFDGANEGNERRTSGPSVRTRHAGGSPTVRPSVKPRMEVDVLALRDRERDERANAPAPAPCLDVILTEEDGDLSGGASFVQLKSAGERERSEVRSSGARGGGGGLRKEGAIS